MRREHIKAYKFFGIRTHLMNTKKLFFFIAVLLFHGHSQSQDLINSNKYEEHHDNNGLIICSFSKQYNILTVVTRGYGTNPLILVKNQTERTLSLNNLQSTYSREKYLSINRYHVYDSLDQVSVNGINMQRCGS